MCNLWNEDRDKNLEEVMIGNVCTYVHFMERLWNRGLSTQHSALSTEH